MALSRPEERTLITLAQAGDQAAARTLIDLVRPLLVRAILSTCRRHPGVDPLELESIGLSTIVRALPYFDFDHAVRWCTYATASAEREICRSAREQARRQARLPLHPDQPDPDTIARLEPDSHGHPLDGLWQAIDALPPILRSVLVAAHGLACDRLPHHRLARRMGITTARLRHLLRLAHDRLRHSKAIYSEGE